MKEGDARPPDRRAAANDNPAALDSAAINPVEVDAALTRIAEAIGRHIAREHIRACKAANDNQPISKNPPPPKR